MGADLRMNTQQLATVGSGWNRLAEAVSGMMPVEEVDAVWVFSAFRRDTKEWGTAVISRIDGERRRIYTARYGLAIKGKERGKFESSVQEVGTGPLEALSQLLAEAHRRIDDEQPPISVPPQSWFSHDTADVRAHGPTG
jgi:hypothetical protein